MIENQHKYNIQYLDYTKQYTLNDIIQVELSIHKYVWVGKVYGGNYDLYTGLCYMPPNITLKSIGTLMKRNEYNNLFI